MRLPPLSFRLKLITGVALIEALLLAVLLAKMLGHLEDTNVRQLHERTQATAALLASAAARMMAITDTHALAGLLGDAIRTPGTNCIRVRDAAGRILAERVSTGRATATAHEAVEGFTPHAPGVYHAVAPVELDGALLGNVQVGLDAGSLEALRRAAYHHGLLIGSLQIGLVILLAYLLGLYLTRQLRELTRAARAIARGDLGLHIPVRGHDDLARTAMAFNSMSTRVQRDITLRKRAESALRLSEERLDHALRATGEGVWDWDCRSDTVKHNRRWCELLQVSEEHLEHPVAFFIELVHPDDRDAVANRLRDALAGDGRYQSTHRMRVAAGRHIWVDDIGEVVERAPDGVVQRMVGSIRDITEQREAEDELRREKATLRTILDTSPIGIGILVDGVTRFVNPKLTDMLGIAAGDPVSDVFVDRRERSDIAGAVASGQFIEAREIQVRDAAGDARDILCSCYPIRYEETDAVLGWAIDISPLKETQLELEVARDMAEAATRAKSEFLANMSHEIRTPMTAILGLSHLALDSGLSGKQQHYVEKVHRSATQLLDIINEILDFSKIEAGRLALEKVPFSLHEVFENLGNMAGLRAEEKGLELIFDLPPELPEHFVGDPLRLGQVLLNLVSNAIKFTEHGEVVVSAAVVEDRGRDAVVEFRVRDTGIGISEDSQRRLFESFRQADGSTARRFGGTGLGLAIAKRITALMQGKIWVESRLQQGSTFGFTARLIPQAETKRSPAPAMPAMPDPTPTVLLIEPNAAARSAFARALEAAGFVVTTTPDPATPPDETSGRWDAVVVDQTSLGECPVAERLDALLAPRAVPPVLLLANTNDRRPDTDGLSVVAVMPKPVLPYGLVEQLALLCSGTGYPPSEYESRDGPQQGAQRPLAGCRVLVAEDNDLNQELICDFLESVGVEVTLAKHGAEALEQLERATFDAVLMDCLMPVMDGYEAARLIRGEPRLRDLPVIAVTASAMQQDRERALAAGMNDQVSKPIDPEQLFATLARWTRHRADVAAPEPQHRPAGQEQLAQTLLATRAEGLDLKRGLALFDGNAFAYLKMLGKFRHAYRDFASRFIAASPGCRNDAGAALRLAHTLKGQAAQIGADRLAEAGAALEEACRQDAADAALSSRLESVRQALAEVDHAIDGLPRPARATTRSPDTTVPAPLLARLRGLLEEDDCAARDVIDEILPLVSSAALLQEYRHLDEKIWSFDFSAAIRQLDLIERQNPSEA